MNLLSVAVVALYALVALAFWIAYQVIRQNGRILMRLEAVEKRLGSTAAPVQAGETGPPEESERDDRPYGGNRPLSSSRIKRDGLPAGSTAPPFRLPRVGGGELSLTDYQGRNVLLVFSDPHCGPCHRLAPDLEQRHRNGRGVDILMVSRGEEAENLQKVSELGLTFPVVRQRQWEVSRAYGMFATPVGFLIDERGVIARHVAVGPAEIVSLLNETEAAS